MVLDENVIQQALIQVADATRAAVQVAQTAVQAQASSLGGGAATSKRPGN